MVREAKLLRPRTPSTIVAITGSIGKTSTRDAIHTVLSAHATSRRNTKNFNLDLGVSRTVLGLSAAWGIPAKLRNIWRGLIAVLRPSMQPEYLVLEVGMEKVGDMGRYLWLKPEVIVYTRFPDVPSHVEFFPTAQSVMDEKLRLKDELAPDGLLVLNADDPKMDDITVVDGQRRMTFGVENSADVTARNVRIAYEHELPVGVSATVCHGGKEEDLLLRGTLGTHHIYPVLAACAVGIGQGYSLKDVVAPFANHVGPRGRMRLLEGDSDTMLIDDSYNASPDAIAAGIRTVQSLQLPGRVVLALGDMLELGQFSEREHKRVGELVSKKCDVFVAVGPKMSMAADIVERELPACRVVRYADADVAAAHVSELMKPQDCIYIKGSGGTRMGAVTQALVAENDRKYTILIKH